MFTIFYQNSCLHIETLAGKNQVRLRSDPRELTTGQYAPVEEISSTEPQGTQRQAYSLLSS